MQLDAESFQILDTLINTRPVSLTLTHGLDGFDRCMLATRTIAYVSEDLIKAMLAAGLLSTGKYETTRTGRGWRQYYDVSPKGRSMHGNYKPPKPSLPRVRTVVQAPQPTIKTTGRRK